MSLCFFGATDKNLSKSDKGMGDGEISIQLQRMFTFGDALSSAPGQNVDKTQVHVAARMVRDRRQGSGQFRFGRGHGRLAIGHKEVYGLDNVRARRLNESVDIAGIGGERQVEKTARSRYIIRGISLVEPSQTLKKKVHRVGVSGLFRAPRLGGGELRVQRACQARDDFVLHVEEIRERLIEPIYQQGFRLVPAVLPASPSGMPSRASRWASGLP